MKTNRRVILLFAVASMMLLTSTMIAASQAADYTTVGVKNGDWVIYSYTMGTFATGSLSGTARVDVTGVSGTIVTVTFQVTYSGQSETETHSGDISTGSGGICSYVIASGLSAGDALYMNAPYIINETITMYVAGASRTINRWQMSESGTTIELSYDRETGLLLRESLVSASMSITIEATSCSAFSADLTPLLIIGGVGGAAVILILIVVVAHRVSRRKGEGEHVTIVPVTLTGSGPTKPTEAPKQSKAPRASVCPFCGAPVVPGATFCASCGTKLTAQQ